MTWVKMGRLFASRGLYTWNKTHAQLPVADIVDGKIIRIYYASRNSAGQSLTSYIEVDAECPSEILYEHNRPILELGKLGAFDESGIMPTCVVNIKDRKYLYYIGWSLKKTVPYQNSVGLAMSTDGGRSFKKFSDGPVVGINHIDPYFTGTFFVFNEKDYYRAYYLSCIKWEILGGRPEPLYVLKYAESENGITWERTGKVAIGLAGQEEGGVVSAAVLRDGTRYKMWFGRRGKFDYRTNTNNAYRIGYAEAEDGLNWTRMDALAGIDVSSEGWDSEMISYPYVLRVADRLYMFYNGNGFGKTGFGYAVWG